MSATATAAPALDVSGAGAVGDGVVGDGVVGAAGFDAWGNDTAGLVLPHPLRLPDAATASIPATSSVANLFDNEVTRTTQAYRRRRVVCGRAVRNLSA